MTSTRWQVAVQVSTVQRTTVHLTVDADNKTSAEALAAAQVRRDIGPGAHNDPPPPLQRVPWRVDKAEATKVEGEQ